MAERPAGGQGQYPLSVPSENSSPLILSELAIRHAQVAAYVAHYHRERNHQGLNNRLIDPERDAGKRGTEVCCRDRLGGMLRYYYREAA